MLKGGGAAKGIQQHNPADCYFTSVSVIMPHTPQSLLRNLTLLDLPGCDVGLKIEVMLVLRKSVV